MTTHFPPLRSALFTACLLLVAPSAASAATDELSSLRAEIEALQARLAALEAARASDSPDAAQPPERKTDPVAAGERPRVGIGGRLHYDVYAHQVDRVPATGGSEIRRARVHVEGEADAWRWRVQAELSGRNTDLRDVYLQRALADGTLTIGQFKPYRSMDELTSSNDGSTMERGFASAAGLFADRSWQQGVGWLGQREHGSLGLAVFSLREDNTPRNEGWGSSVRATWVPWQEGSRLVHLGAWYSVERGGEGTPAIDYDVAYAGRRGPVATLFESGVGGAFSQDTLGLEFAGRSGGFHWQGEWARADVAGLAGGGRLEASYLQTGYLFGGMRDYAMGKGVFGAPATIGRGLWELVARVDHLRAGGGRGDVRRWVLGTNWYVNDGLRLMLNWTHGEDVATGDTPSQLAFRAQYVF